MNNLEPKPKDNESANRVGLLSRLAGRLLGSKLIDQPSTKEAPVYVDISETLTSLHEAGFSTAKHGTGPWIPKQGHDAEQRIVEAWQISHEDGRVVAIDTYKGRDYRNEMTHRSFPVRSDYPDPEAYSKHTEEWQLEFGDDMLLADVIAKNTDKQTD